MAFHVSRGHYTKPFILSNMPIAVAIVEDNSDIRMGTAYILRTSRACILAGEYGTAEDLIDAFESISPDVVLMDIGLPGMSGIEAIELLKRDHPRLEIVVFSIFEDDENVFRAICAGASGYLAKPVMPHQLLEAVEHAFGGGTPMSPHIARKVLEMFRQNAPPPRADYHLTPRECEVLDLLVKGEDYKSIAEKLFLSLFTVRAHIRNIYNKLHVHTKSQAVAKALKENVVPPR
jgi:DNA-binding NarL/FixJ family response regulator